MISQYTHSICPFPEGLTCTYVSEDLFRLPKKDSKTQKAFILIAINSQTSSKELSTIITEGRLALISTEGRVVQAVGLNPNMLQHINRVNRFVFLTGKLKKSEEPEKSKKSEEPEKSKKSEEPVKPEEPEPDAYLLGEKLKIQRFEGEVYDTVASQVEASHQHYYIKDSKEKHIMSSHHK